MLICKFCCKECKNQNSLRNHERTCPSNEDRVYKNGMLGKKGGNQYTKAKQQGLPKPEVSQETREKLASAVKNRSTEFNREIAKKISETIKRKVEEGSWHTSLAKRMHVDYNGNDLHGSWELKYAQYLDVKGIKWVRNKDTFSYIYDGEIHKYTPDFYLPDSCEYIEIKGYKTDKDLAKWSQFPKHRKLIVLMKEELKQLDVI